jgi:tetratricopeptide (TPR) repeat protein
MPRGPKPTPITLSDDERAKLTEWARRPKTAQRLALRSRIILAAADGQANAAIAADLRVTLPTVRKWRDRFSQRRLEGLAGDPAGATADFTRVLELAPKTTSARVNRAAAQIQLGNFEAAVADCNEVLKDDPKHRDAVVNRATARIMLRDFAGAVADADTLLATDPVSIEGLYIRGVARTGLEQFTAALADLEIVVKRAAALAAGWAARGNARYHLSDPGAAADYREAFRLDSTAATRVILRLVRDHARHRPAEVLAECQKFRSKDRNDVISLARRGLTRLFQNRPADASVDFSAFRKLVPADTAILDQLIAAANKAVAAKKGA